MSRQWREQDFFAADGKGIRPSGQDLKQAGINLVAAHNDEWMAKALRNLTAFMHHQPEFTLEDFRREWRRYGNPEPTHSNAWGSVTRTAAGRGMIAKTGEYRQATEPSSHARMLPVWKRV